MYGTSFLKIGTVTSLPLSDYQEIDEMIHHVKQLECVHLNGVHASGYALLTSLLALRSLLPVCVICPSIKLQEHLMTEIRAVFTLLEISSLPLQLTEVHLNRETDSSQIALLEDSRRSDGNDRPTYPLTRRR